MKKNPNVLLMVFDALRPDYLSCYGRRSSKITPGFDSVANNGTVFENAFTVGRNTPISHGVMFTGRYPSQTGLVGGFRSIPEDAWTLAEHMNENGYSTFAISRKTGMLNSKFGHDRGFHEFFEPDKQNVIPEPSTEYLRTAFSISRPMYFKELLRTLRYGPDDTTSLKFELLLDRIKKAESPYFGFINQITTHGPYCPPRPYMSQSVPSFKRTKFHLTEWLGSFFGRELNTLDHPGVRSEEVIHWRGSDLTDNNFNDEEWLTESELTILRQWYGASVEYLDQQLQSFLNALEREGELDDTIVILTADHGEYLGEHELIGHSHFLFDEVQQVPLIIAGPGIPSNERRTDLVSLIDLYKTICDECGIDSPPGIEETPMFGTEHRDAVFAEYGIRDIDKMGYGDVNGRMRDRLEAGLKTIRTDEFKYALDSNGDDYLYKLPEEELVEDPDLKTVDNLKTRLLDTLGPEFKRKLDHDETEISDQAMQNIRNLGYVD